MVRFKQHIGRRFNDKWKISRSVKIAPNSDIRQELEKKGIEVVDANEYVNQPTIFRERVNIVGALPPGHSSGKDHPLWNDQHCYLYTNQKFVEGVAQAEVLCNSVRINDGLPERIHNLEGLEEIPAQDQVLQRLIKSCEIFEATQKKLPKVIDIKRLGLAQPREYGCPIWKKNWTLLDGMLHLCQSLASRYQQSPPRISIFQPTMKAAVVRDGDRVMLEPSIQTLSTSSQPLDLFASAEEVEMTASLHLPDIYPSRSVINFPQHNIYDFTDVYPVPLEFASCHPHTLFVTTNNRLKFKIKEPNVIGMSLVSCFAAATCQAHQLYGDSVGVLPKPICVQCVHTEGRYFHFLCFQLNTLDLGCSDSVKNIYWSVPWEPLYDACGEEGGRPFLHGYNPDIFKIFMAFYLNGLVTTWRTSDSAPFAPPGT